MSVEIQWTEDDPAGGKRFVKVERFAGRWAFLVRAKRRDDWLAPTEITKDMWETLLDAVERRYARREGISDADVSGLKHIIAMRKPTPGDDRSAPAAEAE